MNNIRMSKYFSRLAIVFIIQLLTPFYDNAQPVQNKIDSLKKVLNTISSDTQKVSTLIIISQLINHGDTLQKIRYANDALNLAKNITWVAGVADASLQLGNIYEYCINNHIKSINYYQQALASARISGSKLTEANSLTCIANVYKSLAQYSKALDYYREVLSLNKGPDIDLAALGNMGVVYTYVGDYPNALSCYDSSLKELDASIRKKKESDIYDTFQMAGLLFTIGDIYLDMLQYERALGNYKSAVELCEQTTDKSYARYGLMGIGKTYRYQKEYVKAIDYYYKALKNCEDFSHKSDEPNIYNQIADVYLETGSTDSAMESAQSALKIAEDNNLYNWLPASYATLGKVYVKMQNYPKAVDYLKKAVDLSNNTGELDLEQDALKALSQAYEQMRQPALAFNAYRQYVSIRDSIYNLGKANEITRIDLQSGYERKQIADSLKQAGAYQLKMQKQQVYTYSGYAGLAMVLLLSFFIYRGYSQEKKANKAISKASEAVKIEKQVSENLLLNILPDDVAQELKAKGFVDAKLFDHVTVLFTDFINFTSAAERFTPQELVAELHACFKAFDDIISKYNIEKIKTVGDAYMAASGLPQPNTAHGPEMVKAAIEIRNFMDERNRQLGDKTFGIRIGINSGTVVAGIVGVKKFAYDIWGDTVNIAARMEQYGAEGKVNISQSTYELVKDSFICTDRGEIDAKHKGRMRMYFVETKA
jgi:adenylate cyclase